MLSPAESCLSMPYFKLKIERAKWNLQDGKFKAAFTALKEAVKHKTENWQTWSNYSEAAYQTENLQAAFHGLQQVCTSCTDTCHCFILLITMN